MTYNHFETFSFTSFTVYKIYNSLEDGDITIFRLLLWLWLCLDLMQGQRVWALSNIWVKEFDIGGRIATIIMQIFC